VAIITVECLDGSSNCSRTAVLQVAVDHVGGLLKPPLTVAWAVGHAGRCRRWRSRCRRCRA
jgi:hypothetical protein